MCFIKIRDGKGDLPLIAGDDIPVWKVLRSDYKSKHIGFKYERGILYSTDMVILTISDNESIPLHYDAISGLSLSSNLKNLYMGFSGNNKRDWVGGWRDIDWVGGWRDIDGIKDHLLCIEEGFHSFHIRDRVPKYIYDKYYISRSKDKADIAVEFIIPKGSEYYLDESGLVVSNQIKMK